MPTKGFSAGGWCNTGRIRIRPSWFLGLAIVEELWESRDGTFEWKRVDGPISLREPAPPKQSP